MGNELTRRDFFKATAGTLGAYGLLNLAGCAGAGSSLIPGFDGYVMTLQYAQQTIGGLRVKTRTYNGGIPGPILKTKPGQVLKVKIDNQLPPDMPWNPGGMGGGGHVPSRGLGTDPEANMNNPRDFNTTNLHVHGLQVIPHLFNPDETMIATKPGETHEYAFQIPGDQPSGLYWYHPHHHGSTDSQVANGMAGLILVEGEIDQVPEIAAAKDILVAIQSLGLDPSVDDPDLYVNEPIPGKGPNEGGYKLGGYAKTIFTVNGQGVVIQNQDKTQEQLALPELVVRPGEVIRLRVLNGTNFVFMPLKLDGHSFHVIGWDGINFLAPSERQELPLAPGNRAEVLIKASMTPGMYILRQLPQNEQFAPEPGKDIAMLVVEGDPLDMPLPSALPTPTREYPLIQDSEIVRSRTIQFNVVFPWPDKSLLTGVGFTLDGQTYDMMRIDQRVALNTAEEWTLTNVSTEGHPFHIHVNSFEVVEGGAFPDMRYFSDTIWIPRGSSVRFRTRFKTWRGKTVYHCHLLIHEDTGMMANFMIE